VKRPLTALLIAPIRLYQRLISPLLGQRCRYYPSCSNYAVQAIDQLGPVRGSILAAWRLLRCNPFSPGGFDELEDRGLFRNTPTRCEGHPHGRPEASGPAPARSELTGRA
jgi:uncharacterized protein